ncbi:MAG: glycoside hydrolase family 3 protein [Micromonosporaceae bacterium]
MTDPALRTLALRTLLASFPGTSAPDWARELLEDGLAGYVLFGYNVIDSDQLHRLVSQLRDTRGDAIVGIDEEGGDVTRLAHADGSRYPGNAALGAVDDPALTRRVHHAIGAELRRLGIGLNLAPSVDVNTSHENPIIGTRSFGQHPARVARHAAAAVRGLRDAGVAACAKHFPGHGATATDSHTELPTVDVPLELLRKRELAPFAAVIAAGVPAIMTAHIRVPELTGDDPATLSRRVLTGLLRDELGFAGAVITDALEMRGACGTIGIPEAAVRSLAAGADLLCIGAEVDAPLVDAVASAIVAAVTEGRLAADRLEQAAERTAVLAALPDPVGKPDLDPDLGNAAARRALRIEGTLPTLRRPLVVQVDAPATIAAGATPWGLPLNGAELIRIMPAETGNGTDPGWLLTVAGDRPIVVVSRDTHRHPYARRLVERLASGHPDVVLVEMGWPAPWRPVGLRAYVATYGAGRANAQAAADALLYA